MTWGQISQTPNVPGQQAGTDGSDTEVSRLQHREQGCPFPVPFLCSRVDQEPQLLRAAPSGSRSTRGNTGMAGSSMAAFGDNSSSKADVDSGAVTHGLK